MGPYFTAEAQGAEVRKALELEISILDCGNTGTSFKLVTQGLSALDLIWTKRGCKDKTVNDK